MANKRTVVEHYDAIKALLNGETVEGYTLNDALAFIDTRIDITQRKKNAKRENAEPTPKQREKMAADTAIENAVIAIMADNTNYTPSDLVKLLGMAEVPNTQKLTPRLTALVDSGRIIKSTEKGRSVYSLVATE